MFLYKLPDFEGGFVTKSIECNCIVTRDDAGYLLDSKPVNYVKKGVKTNFGKVVDYSRNFVILKKGSELKRVKRESLNNVLIKSLDQSEYKPEIILDEPTITGKFKTIVGEVLVKSGKEIARDILTDPDKLIEKGRTVVFSKTINGEEVEVTAEKQALFSKSFLMKGISVKEKVVKRKILIKGFAATLKTPKIFNINSSSSGGGSAWNAKGGMKPNHKYIERKPAKNGEGYIYLYELPSGKREWRDEAGKTVEGGQASADYQLEDFKVGDIVRQDDKLGRIKETSTNMLAVNFGGEIKVINKKEHVEKVKQHQLMKEGDTIQYEGNDAEILRVTGKLALINTADKKLKIINLEKRLEKYEPQSAKGRGEEKRLNKFSDVYQGEAERRARQGGADNYNISYEEQPGYKDFLNAAKKTGFGRKNDLEMVKRIQVGDRLRVVRWNYNPELQDVSFMVDGVENYPLNFGGKKYLIRDITDDGYSLEDKETKEKGLFLSHKDYNEYAKENNEMRGDLKVEKVGGVNGYEIVKEPARTFRFKPEYTEEERARFEGRSGRRPSRWTKQATESLQSEDEKKRLVELQAERDKKNKEVLGTKDFADFEKLHKERGFEIGANRFHATKEIEAGGRTFKIKSEFKPDKMSWQTSIDGPVKKLQLGEKHLPITDISKDKVFYHEGGDEKSISFDELKTINGKSLFEPTKVSKGVISNLDPVKIYFGNNDKDVTSGTYEIVEAKDLIASHKPDGTPNRDYKISDAQNRDRSTPQSIAQINKIATNPNFDFLSDSKTAQDGAPIVDEDYNVIAGNGREIGVQQHYDNKGEKYRNDLLKNAEKYGFNRDDIEKMQQPILVRRTNVDKNEAQRLGAISNTSQMLATEERESAKGKATRIDDATINNLAGMFTKENHESLNQYLDEIGPDVVSELLSKKIIPENEAHLYIDPKSGKMDAGHKEKVKQILTQSVLGESSQHFEKIPEAARAGTVKSLGDIFALKGKEGDLVPHLQEAVKILAKYEAVKDNFKSPDDFVKQAANDAFEPLKGSKEGLALFELLSGTKPNEMKDKIHEYKLSMEGDMFGEGKTAKEAFDEVFKPRYEKGINKGLRLGLRIRKLLFKAVDTTKNILLPSKKNPAIKRWQSTAGMPAIKKQKWYRGVDERNKNAKDKFYSADKEIAGDFGEVEELNPNEMPKNPLKLESKKVLAEQLGYEGNPYTESRFDEIAKAHAQKLGYDAIIYENGTFEEPELHKFGEVAIKQTETENFKKWFGESKVVDNEGDPAVTYPIKVYHGSKKEFFEFKKELLGKNTGDLLSYFGFHFTEDKNMAQSLFASKEGNLLECYLTIRNPYVITESELVKEALLFAQKSGMIDENKVNLRKLFKLPYYSHQGNSIASHLINDAWKDSPLINYKEVTNSYLEELKKRGFDGIQYKNEIEWAFNERYDWIAFEPTQIKSATGNDGSFDPENADITKSTKITRKIVLKKKKKNETFLL